MEIAWFSEAGFNSSSTPRDFPNMRTEYAWYVAQNAHHYNIATLPELKDNSFDLGIIIIPKKVAAYVNYNIVDNLKRVCKKYAFMQEGPSWYFQELNVGETFWFYNIMLNADFGLAHNEKDLSYYQGLLKKRVYINPTLMIEDLLKDLPKVDREGVIVGGNIGHFYGGFNSMVVGLEIADKVFAPQMGRMKREERGVQEIEHLPYVNWIEWMHQLNNFKYAVHLNPNTIAGTFSLNCAYLGIPCIGNSSSDTQRMCFPEISVHPTEIASARYFIKQLRNDKDFYNEISKSAKENYKLYYSEETYKKNWQNILDEEFKKD